MTRKSYINRGITAIELLIVLAILSIIGVLVFRILYFQTIIEMENELWKAIGVEPSVGKLIVGVSAIILIGVVYLKKKKKRNRNRLEI